MKILEIKPEPLIVSDSSSHFLAIFGGILPLMSSYQVSTDSSAISELQKEIVDFTEDLSPLLDEAYRIEMSSYTNREKLLTDIEPFRKTIRFATSTSDWRMDPSLQQTFQSLRNIILEQFLEGRHTAFGLTPSTKQLYFTHILQKDSRKIHEFVALLQMKILELFSLQGKLHFLSQQNMLNITILLEAFSKEAFNGDDKLIYF